MIQGRTLAVSIRESIEIQNMTMNPIATTRITKAKVIRKQLVSMEILARAASMT